MAMEEETHSAPNNLLRSYHTLMRYGVGRLIYRTIQQEKASTMIAVSMLSFGLRIQQRSFQSRSFYIGWKVLSTSKPLPYLHGHFGCSTCLLIWPVEMFPNSPPNLSQPHRGNQNCTKPLPPVVIDIKGIWIFASETLEIHENPQSHQLWDS